MTKKRKPPTCPGCGAIATYVASKHRTYACLSAHLCFEGVVNFQESVTCVRNQRAQRDKENAELGREVNRLAAIVKKLPVKPILAACKLIDAADNRAMASDGSPVPPTASVMSAKELQTCLTALWKTRAAAEAAKEH